MACPTDWEGNRLMYLLIPLATFWMLIFIGRSELGFKGVAFWILLWLGLLVGFMMLNLPSYWFTVAQVLMDTVLIIIIFGGDIRIR
ncbi:MAG: hypothetical protein A2Z25_17405 [Planctomycetes bacterium RBG_16_55_9]|nr:MAG: hypothetical protein A2Z25_17405 [Planctomycetes bacterium RBG_16_55_9]